MTVTPWIVEFLQVSVATVRCVGDESGAGDVKDDGVKGVQTGRPVLSMTPYFGSISPSVSLFVDRYKVLIQLCDH